MHSLRTLHQSVPSPLSVSTIPDGGICITLFCRALPIARCGLVPSSRSLTLSLPLGCLSFHAFAACVAICKSSGGACDPCQDSAHPCFCMRSVTSLVLAHLSTLAALATLGLRTRYHALPGLCVSCGACREHPPYPNICTQPCKHIAEEEGTGSKPT